MNIGSGNGQRKKRIQTRVGARPAQIVTLIDIPLRIVIFQDNELELIWPMVKNNKKCCIFKIKYIWINLIFAICYDILGDACYSDCAKSTDGKYYCKVPNSPKGRHPCSPRRGTTYKGKIVRGNVNGRLTIISVLWTAIIFGTAVVPQLKLNLFSIWLAFKIYFNFKPIYILELRMIENIVLSFHYTCIIANKLNQ